MKQLWNVIVVSLDEAILLDTKVVADDREGAILAAGVADVLKQHHLKPSDVTILTAPIGAVRVRPEPQKVIVQKES